MASANQLSFLPDDYLERKAQRRTNAICATLFIVVMVGICSAFTLSEKATRQQDQEYAAVQQQYLNEAKRIGQVSQMQQKQKHMARQAELTRSLMEGVPRSRILAEITDALPAGVSLLDFTLDSKLRAKPVVAAPKTAYELKKAAKQSASQAAAAAAEAETLPEPKRYDVLIKLTGLAFTDVQVSQFMTALSAREKLFKDVNLVITDEYKMDKEKVRQFQINLGLRPDVDLNELSLRKTATTAVELTGETEGR